MRAFGAPTEDLEAVEAALQQQAPPPVSEDFSVYHDNWLITQTFDRCGTQWSYVSVGGLRTPTVSTPLVGVRSGLNYPGVDVVVRRFVPRKLQQEVWEGLQVMERAVLIYDSEQAAD